MEDPEKIKRFFVGGLCFDYRALACPIGRPVFGPGHGLGASVIGKSESNPTVSRMVFAIYALLLLVAWIALRLGWRP